LEKLSPALQKKYPKSIYVKPDGHFDFTPYAIDEVKIKMKGNTTSDFVEANKASKFDKKPKGYTWHHHEDRTTMQLVPRLATCTSSLLIGAVGTTQNIWGRCEGNSFGRFVALDWA
jgi:hypothetical protein